MSGSAFAFHLSTRIVWHTPAAEAVVSELSAMGISRALLVTDPGLAATPIPASIASALEAAGVAVAVCTEVHPNPTTDDVAAARLAAETQDAQAVVAVGGGSAIDVGKATAMLLANGGQYSHYQWDGKPIEVPSIAFVAVPTTSGTGSEVSKVAVISDPSQPFKKGVRSPLMAAHAAVLDPELTVGLPPLLTAATGIDAFVHAFEAYVGRNANPISDLFAIEAMRLVLGAVERATADGTDLDARHDMMLAAVYGGIAMDQAGLGLVHAIAGGLGGHVHLHHGMAVAMLLPHVAAFNLPDVDEHRLRRLDSLFAVSTAQTGDRLVESIDSLLNRLALPTFIGAAGAESRGVDWNAAVEDSMRMVMIHNNPRTADADDCRTIIDLVRSDR